MPTVTAMTTNATSGNRSIWSLGVTQPLITIGITAAETKTPMLTVRPYRLQRFCKEGNRYSVDVSFSRTTAIRTAKHGYIGIKYRVFEEGGNQTVGKATATEMPTKTTQSETLPSFCRKPGYR